MIRKMSDDCLLDYLYDVFRENKSIRLKRALLKRRGLSKRQYDDSKKWIEEVSV